MYVLRPYQSATIDALIQALNDGVDRPLVCLPTGSGKSAVICTFIHQLSQRFPHEKFLITAHTQELIAQLARTYEAIAGTPPSVYCSGLRRKETGNRDDQSKIIVGQIQSISKHATKFGRFKLIACDECDRIPVAGDGQYRTFLGECRVINPDLRVCGFTATPYRLGTGLCFGPEQPFSDLVYDAGIRDLIADGYLSTLTAKDGGKPDLTGVHSRQGEFIPSELEAVMTDETLVEKACDEICQYGRERKAWLVFSSGLKHAGMVSAGLERRGLEAPIIEGGTPDVIRKQLVDRFRAGTLRCLVNINVLSIGFDAPHVDLLALLRPTQSPGLYYQQVGRGLRTAPGKSNCLVLDLAGNIARHGPIDTLNERIKQRKAGKPGDAPVKTCEACKEIVPAGCRRCPACGAEFPEIAIAKHNAVAATDSPLFNGAEHTMDVMRVAYRLHQSRDESKPATIRVTYRDSFRSVDEWWSPDARSHPFARNKTLQILNSTPRVVNDDKRLEIEHGVMVGYDGPIRHIVSTAQDFLTWVECLATPSQVTTVADPTQPKYRKVVKRVY